ncbi:MAG: acyl-CoA thioesterase [Verrucomicrobia bacterium]|nr:MAG: acyl-CoA thioesterase [Verrucomicrobiota bacterium]
MKDPTASSNVVFRHEFVVPKEAIDGNGHVNNVVYIQWMQDVAIRHADACGGTAALEAIDCTWVVRSHTVKYLKPAYEGDRIEARTWVVDMRRVRSLRRTAFVRLRDGKVIVRGETDWVLVSELTGRPCAIPEIVSEAFPVA